jgi:hypothetical protein
MDRRQGCLTAPVMSGVPGVRVLAAEPERGGGLRLTVETDQQDEGCRRCGVLALPHGRREHLLHDAPFGHRHVRVMWRKRVWRCPEPACATVTFTESHALARPRALRIRRAVIWAADALSDDDTTVSALARRLDVDWHTLWDARGRSRRRADSPDRLHGVESLGVDEHIWRPGKSGQGREVTCMVDLTRNANGQVRARLLDLVLGRSGPAYAGCLDARQRSSGRRSPRSAGCCGTAWST